MHCDNLYNGDSVYVEGYNDAFKFEHPMCKVCVNTIRYIFMF